jgi:hypothetical protein
VLRRIFEPKKDEVTGEWRTLHSEDPNDLYSLSNIIQVIKWRRMRWTEHVAHTGYRRCAYRVLVGRPEHLQDGRIILKFIFTKWDEEE